MTPREGGCACGAARYRLNDEPIIVHCCHCLDCQRLSGGAFAINALIELDRIELSGAELHAIEVPREAGPAQRILRCPNCQVALDSHYGRGDVCFVRAGTLDEPHSVEPDVHIFTRSKLPWVRLPTSVPAFEELYDVPSVWPAESLARLEELRSRST